MAKWQLPHGLEIGRRTRSALLAGCVAPAMLMICGAGFAFAGPPPLPSSLQSPAASAPAEPAENSASTPAGDVSETVPPTASDISMPFGPVAPAGETADTTETSAAPAASGPAERKVADDEAARLAAEVPAEEIGAKPASEWLESEVGTISTRPVSGEAGNSKDMLIDEPAAAAAPAAAASAPVIEQAKSIEIVEEPSAKVSEDAPVVALEAEEPVSSETAAAAPAVDSYSFLEALRSIPSTPKKVVTSPQEPKIVTIRANFSDAVKGEKDAAVEAASSKSDASASADDEDAKAQNSRAFALIWMDGEQRAGDTMVKFYQPGRIFFANGKECLTWAKTEAIAGRAPAPNGVQPADLSAVCIGATDETSLDYWIWRKRSGAFSRSELLPAQANLYRQVIKSWMASGPQAYATFPEVPVSRSDVAGQ